MFTRLYTLLTAALVTALLMACVSTPDRAEVLAAAGATEDMVKMDDLVLVDCLLPGQVRQLGQYMTYLAPRRWTKTTQSDCGIRGGEFVLFDRSDYSTALQVLMPKAQSGDAMAQNYVGEIYEKGLGLPRPDYVQAAVWYRKAADGGLPAAQTNLGLLYEQGLGVPQDRTSALQWYRKATGVDADGLVLESQLEAERVAFQQEITLRNQVAAKLTRQLQRARADSPPSARAAQPSTRAAVPKSPAKSRRPAAKKSSPAPIPVSPPSKSTAPSQSVASQAAGKSTSAGPTAKPGTSGKQASAGPMVDMSKSAPPRIGKATVKLGAPALERAAVSLRRDAQAQVEQVKRTLHAVQVLKNAAPVAGTQVSQVSGKKSALMGKLELTLRQRSDALVDNQQRLTMVVR
ncbi:tetratricopeptide repeat protein [Thiospirillum jenense]|uniref:SEL1-like repeat protein n=1 Tax=Thiospirillum jenense TaxID=1653858 RepID=A0A839HB15_9GAMM|nr:tetratricopeptide repeat protein [Thiospirillum jenense]MBB1125420.1 SEL1-like repeat protein [Thiospirillum jenense]